MNFVVVTNFLMTHFPLELAIGNLKRKLKKNHLKSNFT